MKGIFSRSGNKKDISGKMDRRSTHSHSTSSVPQHNGRVVNSFIPTSATYGQSSHNPNGHHSSKLVGSAAPIHQQPQQQQLQQMSNVSVQQQHGNHYYSNVPPTVGGTVSSTRQEHHYSNYQQQSVHHQSQQSSHQFQQRSLTKSYSSHNNQHQQSHYGNTTTGHVNNNNNNPNLNHNPYYGNASNNLLNGNAGPTGIMNGHHHSSEKNSNPQYNISNSQVHHNQLQQQQTYSSHQQVHHQQQIHQMQNVQIQHQSNQNKVNHHHNQVQQMSHSQSSQYHQNSTNTSNISIGPPSATEGLPSTLVESMRTLFDILDDTKQGKIRLSDIETRWEIDSNGSNGKGSGAEPLIKMGVLEYLRKVTPTDGMLTFDRFCSGLRLALLTNPDSGVDSGMQIPDKYHSSPPQQQYFQDHVKSISQSNKMHFHASQQSQSQFNTMTINNNNSLGQKSSSAAQLPHAGQSNTIHRMSKIPNLSASRLPMPNSGTSSGIPISPTNRGSGGVISPPNGSNIPNGGLNKGHHTPVSVTNSRRYNLNSEHTTIALVHPQPPPNPKPGVGMVQPTTYSSNGTLKIQSKQNSTAPNVGYQNRFSSRNNSLDDLKAPAGELIQQPSNNSSHGERPPSAPILDGDADDNLDENENRAVQKRHVRERAKSQERDRSVNGHGHGGHQSRAEEKSNFVKSRQRTLSMPQLQLNKLKPKSSGVNFEDSPTEKVIPSPSVESSYIRPSALKNSGHSTSKLNSGSNNNVSSSIPTMSTTHSLKFAKGDIISSHATAKELYSKRVEDKESPSEIYPPPPPKPPRNAMSGPGPVTISTTLLNNATNEPPLSNSSFGSVQSSNATLSPSTSSSGGGGSKPSEIRTVLHSWQKSMTDKKPVEQSLSVTSIATSSSINTNDTTKSAPPTSVSSSANMVNKEKPGDSTNDDSRTTGYAYHYH
jgi:hypothetical protein